jgi:hypothetical protein
MKVLCWIIALLGLWEFGDIVALFVPGFGNVPNFVWNHIIVGMILVIVSVWAVLTSSAGTAKTMNWIAVVSGAWLIISSFILRYPIISVGLWNDVVVGVIVIIPGVWAAFTSPRVTG